MTANDHEMMPSDSTDSVAVRSSDSLRSKILSLRPLHQHVEAERLERSLAAQMFGASDDPTRIGRFVILGRLGAGGMGVVYSAYDPRLDRRVALKLLRDSSRVGHVERERLLREAHALARISHPNVVTVHEVGEIDDQVFVVMEFVVGKTLAEWNVSGTRSVVEVLGVYRQAGQGLAAAHSAGLVHRDFKPQNALIGDDGRVRVVDFGLARGEPSREPMAATSLRAELPAEPLPPARISSDCFDATLTHSDALVGTPAYMSPEQYAGREVGPASDQFGFCVALYEALTGEHPFVAGSATALATRVVEGDLKRSRSSRVPAWLLTVVRRGLSVNPRGRYPSMDALLAALARDPARARRRWGWGLAGAAGAGLLALGVARLQPSAVPCEASARALDDVWSEARAGTLRQHFGALPTPDATVVGDRVLDTLDTYAERWRAMHEDACLAHHHGEQSGALLDKRMACLGRRRAALDSAIGVLTTADVETFQNAPIVVHDLPALYSCSDLEELEAELPVPEDAALALDVQQVREQLARTLTLATAGRFAVAHDDAIRLEQEARRMGYEPLLAEALLVAGQIEMEYDHRDGERPSATLREAFELGVASRNDAVAAEALVRRLFVEAIRPGGKAPTEGDYGLARAMLERLPGPSHLEGLFLNNAGSIAASQGDYEQARALLRRALAARLSAPEPNPIEILETRFNLALMSENETSQLAGLKLALEGFERELGPAHPRSMTARLSFAQAMKDPRQAERELAALCGEGSETDPTHFQAHGNCVLSLAILQAGLGREADAAASFERAIEVFEPWSELLLPKLCLGMAHAHLATLRGKPELAVSELRAVLDALGASPTPQWLAVYLARIHVGLGRALLASGRSGEAVVELEGAIEPIEVIVASHVEQASWRLLNETRLSLARALLASRPDDPVALGRARSVLDAAIDGYHDGGPGYASHLEEARRLRATLAD